MKIEKQIYISDKLNLINTNNDNNKIIASANINKDELLIIEYPIINLFDKNHEKNQNRELKIIKKYIENKDKSFIQDLYPRTKIYKKTNMIKIIHKLIKNAKDDNKLYMFFSRLDKEELEFYFAKYLYNTFEGNNFGPLTLPYIAKINHSCNPNVRFLFNKDDCCMYVYANKNIKKNSEILDSYIENKKIDNHKLYLEEHYGFNCGCKD
jgi:hypothetical protein